MNGDVVVDASVAAKWFLKDEADVPQAEWLFLAAKQGDITLHAPSIFPHELCNLLARACALRGPRRPSRLKLEQALFAVHGIFGLPVEVGSLAPRGAALALEYAVVYHKAFDDMTYLALAGELDCPWVTADRKILRACPVGFPVERITLLSTLPA
jgi:predicted nucleic acid-binding protein